MNHKLRRGSLPLALTIFLLIVSIAGITLVFIQSKVDIIKSSVQANENSVTDAAYNSLLTEEFNQLLCKATYSVTDQTIVNDGNYIPIEANLESQIFSKLQNCASNSSVLMSALGSPSNSSSIMSVLSRLKNQSIDYNWFDSDNNAGAGYLLWPQGGLPSLPQRAIANSVSEVLTVYNTPNGTGSYTIADLKSLTNVTTTNGTVSYSCVCQTITVTVSGGTGTPYSYMQGVSKYATASIGPTYHGEGGSVYYGDGTYSGTLSLTGTSTFSKSVSGSQTYPGKDAGWTQMQYCDGTYAGIMYLVGSYYDPKANVTHLSYSGTASATLYEYGGLVYGSILVQGTEYIYPLTINYVTLASNPNATFPSGVGDIPLEDETIILNTHADGMTSMSTMKISKFNMHVVLTGNAVVCTLTGKLLSSGS